MAQSIPACSTLASRLISFFVALPIRSDALLNALAEPLLDERSYVSLTGGTVFGGVTFSEYEQSSEWRMPGSRIEKVL
ncbi:hypothetical protein HYQ44_015027 [Verticillium longisporum]|nr:hypothetical protein HYQ44_015027 [Verticillium longisporum]